MSQNIFVKIVQLYLTDFKKVNSMFAGKEWYNKLFVINQVYYWRIFYQTHKIQQFTINIKTELFSKVIKNAKLEGLGWEI